MKKWFIRLIVIPISIMGFLLLGIVASFTVFGLGLAKEQAAKDAAFAQVVAACENANDCVSIALEALVTEANSYTTSDEIGLSYARENYEIGFARLHSDFKGSSLAFESALPAFERACLEFGDQNACASGFDILLRNLHDIPKGEDSSFYLSYADRLTQLASPACEKGNLDACYALADSFASVGYNANLRATPMFKLSEGVHSLADFPFSQARYDESLETLQVICLARHMASCEDVLINVNDSAEFRGGLYYYSDPQDVRYLIASCEAADPHSCASLQSQLRNNETWGLYGTIATEFGFPASQDQAVARAESLGELACEKDPNHFECDLRP